VVVAVPVRTLKVMRANSSRGVAVASTEEPVVAGRVERAWTRSPSSSTVHVDPDGGAQRPLYGVVLRH
jgi:hypothetical protein